MKTFTVTHPFKLRSHEHLLWTSARALAPSSPIELPRKSISVKEELAFKASDAMVENV
jgi:hypothetical protein